MKVFKYRFIILVMLLISLVSCLSDDHFGQSSLGLITEFGVLGQVGDTEIHLETKTIKVTVLGNKDAVLVTKMKISPFASSDVGFGSVINLTTSFNINVIAEDGTVVTWLVNP